MSTRGVAKLIDFGIAKARDRASATDTNSGVLKGKIQYMAPEQALGRPVDRRADVWAVGAILYHLLAGKPPYEGDNQLATLHLLGSGRPPVPLPPAVHPAIARASCRRRSRTTPEERYETALELRDAIEDAMVEAMVPTTTGDVAAFSAEHLADRAERRRAAIDIAVAAAAERRRVEDLLKPTSNRTSVTSATPHSAPRPVGMPQALESVPSPRGEMTLPEVPVAKGPSDALAKLTPRVSEPPPNAQSYATLGSAALESSPALPTTRSRKGVVAAVVLIGAAAVIATVVSFTMFKPASSQSSGASTAATAANGPAGTTASPTAQGTQPAGTASSAASQGAPDATAKPGAPPAIPTMAASSLPKVTPKVPVWTPPPRWTPPPATAAPTAAPTAAKPKPKVDDGF